MGVQNRPPFQGEVKKPARMVWLNFELPSKLTLDDGKEVNHRISTRDLTFSNDPKAALFKIVKALDPEDNFKGDLTKLAGMGVLVTITHAKVKQVDGSEVTYANFAGVQLPPDGFPIPEATEAPTVFSFDSPTPEALAALPKFISEKIKNAVNYKGSKVEALVNATPAETPKY